ncbi:MAG: glycoside hydrolase family 5 protein [Chloroflexota bacterium]
MPHYGFNFLWMFSQRRDQAPLSHDDKALDFLAEYGFNFVRIPTDYRFWTKDFDYFHPDEAVFTYLDRYLEACRSRGIHMSLNLHRAPGYCINANHIEKHNLWQDEIAQDAFVFLWETFARRYRGVSGKDLSFDLVNEPPEVGQYGLTRDTHAAIMRRTVAAIRAIDPQRAIAIDGLGGGHLAMPELAGCGRENGGLGVIHSGRGYQPMPVSHHAAQWWPGYAQAPDPQYPGLEWDGRIWDRDGLRAFYQPWREVETAGATVHIGEMGCFNRTPNDIALRWFEDLFGLYGEFGWGYSLWEFEGAFGIVRHGRPGAVYEKLGGYEVDRALLSLMLANRV